VTEYQKELVKEFHSETKKIMSAIESSIKRLDALAERILEEETTKEKKDEAIQAAEVQQNEAAGVAS
jgi:hypothetical protein